MLTTFNSSLYHRHHHFHQYHWNQYQHHYNQQEYQPCSCRPGPICSHHCWGSWICGDSPPVPLYSYDHSTSLHHQHHQRHICCCIILILSKYDKALFFMSSSSSSSLSCCNDLRDPCSHPSIHPPNLPHNYHLFIMIQVVIIILPNNTIGNQDWSIMQLWPKYYANIFSKKSINFFQNCLNVRYLYISIIVFWSNPWDATDRTLHIAMMSVH